jgi:hypothetical protein
MHNAPTIKKAKPPLANPLKLPPLPLEPILEPSIKPLNSPPHDLLAHGHSLKRIDFLVVVEQKVEGLQEGLLVGLGEGAWVVGEQVPD